MSLTNAYQFLAEDILIGQAPAAVHDFRQWFDDDLRAWCARHQIPFGPQLFGLRNTGILEIQWQQNQKGEALCEVESSHPDIITLFFLLAGEVRFAFLNEQSRKNVTLCLIKRPGDYLILKGHIQYYYKWSKNTKFITAHWK